MIISLVIAGQLHTATAFFSHGNSELRESGAHSHQCVKQMVSLYSFLKTVMHNLVL